MSFWHDLSLKFVLNSSDAFSISYGIYLHAYLPPELVVDKTVCADILLPLLNKFSIWFHKFSKIIVLF